MEEQENEEENSMDDMRYAAQNRSQSNFDDYAEFQEASRTKTNTIATAAPTSERIRGRAVYKRGAAKQQKPQQQVGQKKNKIDSSALRGGNLHEDNNQ